MYTLLLRDSFVASAKRLNIKTKVRLNTKLHAFASNPFYSTLHTKPLHGKLDGLHSFRIGRDYRVVFQFLQNKTIALVDIARRDKVYQ